MIVAVWGLHRTLSPVSFDHMGEGLGDTHTPRPPQVFILFSSLAWLSKQKGVTC